MFASCAAWALGVGEKRRVQRREDPREQEGKFQTPLYPSEDGGGVGAGLGSQRKTPRATPTPPDLLL